MRLKKLPYKIREFFILIGLHYQTDCIYSRRDCNWIATCRHRNYTWSKQIPTQYGVFYFRWGTIYEHSDQTFLYSLYRRSCRDTDMDVVTRPYTLPTMGIFEITARRTIIILPNQIKIPSISPINFSIHLMTYNFFY